MKEAEKDKYIKAWLLSLNLWNSLFQRILQSQISILERSTAPVLPRTRLTQLTQTCFF